MLFRSLNPDEKTVRHYEQLVERFKKWESTLLSEKDFPTVSRDGVSVEIMANIEMPEEIERCVSNSADGVGLYRTEFLFLQGGEPPSEERHYEVYSQAIKALKGRPLTIRTFDLGADKTITGVPNHERNPGLGARSIRLSMQHQDIFRSQLRAVFRASVKGDVKLLLPMITTIGEIQWTKEQIAIVQDELTKEHTPFSSSVPLGIMIEVPAAAVCADLLAEHCDFFSLGTNDLIQYTLAVDRTNEQVASLFNPSHLSVLRLIKNVIDVGERCDIPVSICGEMGGDIAYAYLLLGMGLRRFSVSPNRIPEIKRMFRHSNVEDASRAATDVLNMKRSKDVSDYLGRLMRQILPYERFEFE